MADALAARGARYVTMARALDATNGKPVGTERPAPKPPLAARPPSLSVTEIETLIRDPYAIYAKHVLKLRPLDPLGRAPDAALRGTLMHAALGEFIAEWRGPFDAAAEARLAALSAEALAEIEAFPDVLAVWSLRLRNIGRWLIGFEAARDAAVAARHAEVDGRLVVVPDAFTLVGRADRIDEMRDGSLAIYDFKTGTPQSEKSVFAGLTPQMTLEAAMARAGAFAGIPAGRSVGALSWLAVGKVGRDEVEIPVAGRQGKLDNDQLADRAHAMLADLAAAFANADQPYLSRARPLMERARYIGDYDHLARVREWALIESEQDLVFMGGGGGGGAP
jgi:ATP-dependent helicase/nuclease subunit B